MEQDKPSSLTQQADPIEWARRLTEVLAGTDTATARFALKIADALNEARISREASEALAQVQREFL